MNLAPAATPAEQRVIQHLESTFGVKADAVQVVPITPRELPAGTAQFYVEAVGLREHGSCNCVVMGDKVYCSRADGDFVRLVREQALRERPDLGAEQLIRLYSLLALPRELKYIDASVLARDAQDYRAHPQVQPPALVRRADGGMSLTFYATPMRAVQPERWIVNISRTDEVTVTSEDIGGR